jgi:predicted nucleic acid-binding protein
MPSREPVVTVYWDSCVFLSYINETVERVPMLDAMLGEASAGRIEIRTSVVSLTEVAFAQIERDKGATSDGMLEAIEDLFYDSSVVTLVEFHELIAVEARDLMRRALDHGWSLKPMDAIQLATAKREGVSAFHTYDQPLTKYAALTGLTIGEPNTPAQSRWMG